MTASSYRPVTLGDVAVSAVAAQAAAVRAVTEHWAHSTRVILALAAAPRPSNGAHGPAAMKIAGSPREVGLGWETSFTRVVTPELIDAFGEISGDEARIHFDGDYAARTRFGGRIGHGLLTASFVSAALSRIPGLVVYLSQDFKFLAPAKPGDVVTALVKVIERPPGKPWMRLRTLCTREDGTVLLEGEAKVLVADEPQL